MLLVVIVVVVIVLMGGGGGGVLSPLMSYLVNIYGLGDTFFAPCSETFKLFRRYRGIPQTLRVHCADNNVRTRNTRN